jgi:hypothetical protein
MVAMIANQGNVDQIDTFAGGAALVEHVCGNSSETVAQALLYLADRVPGMPVGFSTDMNTLFCMAGPRFGRDACPGGKKSGRHGQENTTRMSYPFVAAPTGASLDRSVAV